MRLYLFQLGQILTGEPILGYLAQTVEGRNVLIDTGYRPGTLTGEPPFLQASPNQLITSQLERIGISPEQIHTLIVTHLDPDHAGFVDAFPNAEAVIQRRHLALARASSAPRFQLTRPAWDHPVVRFQEVDGDAEICPGIQVLETSGHVTGHQSVLLRLANTGPVLLPIDAMAREHLTNADSRRCSPFDENEEELRRSTRKLIELAERGKAWIIFAHDAEQWRTLRESPEYYD